MRKVVRAARTEGDLEADRLEGALADELREAKARAAGKSENEKEKVKENDDAVQPDLADVSAAHLEIIRTLIAERESQFRPRRVELLWARSNATHAVWCERRHAATAAASAMTRDVICVAQIEKGKVVERWFFG